MTLRKLAVVSTLLAFGAGCGARVVAVSDPRTTYVVKQGFLGTSVLHCQAQEGANPEPVCTEVKEVK